MKKTSNVKCHKHMDPVIMFTRLIQKQIHVLDIIEFFPVNDLKTTICFWTCSALFFILFESPWGHGSMVPQWDHNLSMYERINCKKAAHLQAPCAARKTRQPPSAHVKLRGTSDRAYYCPFVRSVGRSFVPCSFDCP